MPTSREIRNALLQELYSKEEYTLNTQDASWIISNGYFTIPDEEHEYPMGYNSTRWENQLQVAKNKLRNEGYILHPKITGKGIWKLSEKGIKYAREIYLKYHDEDPHIDLIGNIVNNDLDALKDEEDMVEGNPKERLHTYYERNPKLRKSAIEIHGFICKACSFDFHKTYGSIGSNFIEVHHLIPISNFIDEHKVNPGTEMTVLCSNCHRMIHKKVNGKILSLEELKNIIKKN